MKPEFPAWPLITAHETVADEGLDPEGMTQAIRPANRRSVGNKPALPFVQQQQQPAPPAAPTFGPPSAPWPPAPPPSVIPPPPPPSMPMVISPLPAMPPAMAQSPAMPPAMAQPPPMPPVMAQPPPVMAPPALPPVMAPPPATFGQQLAHRQWSASEAQLQPVPAAVEAPPQRAASRSGGRALELLWCADDAAPRAREAPLVANAFGAPDAQGEGQAAARRAVHRGLARLSPVEDLAHVLWSAVDDDGALTPPIVAVAGELELCFDDADLARTLASVARPYAESDGALDERLTAATGIADRLPEASDLIARELDALRTAWAEREVSPPMEELEASAKRILLMKRKLRTLSIFEAVHVVGLLRTGSHASPVPVYLPEAAQARLPLESRFEVQLLAEVHPRQVADEPCPLVIAALAVARVLRGG